MNRLTKTLEKLQPKKQLPEFGPGDQVRVWYRIIEHNRVRQAPFEGLVIRRRGSGLSETFTVRRITHGEGVERIFPVHAPVLERIDVLRRGKVRRARLYYLRAKVGKTRIDAAEQAATAAAPLGESAPGAALAHAEAPAEPSAVVTQKS